MYASTPVSYTHLDVYKRQIEFNELKSEEKVIRNTRFYETEIKNLENELAELRAVSYKNKSERACLLYTSRCV